MKSRQANKETGELRPGDLVYRSIGGIVQKYSGFGLYLGKEEVTRFSYWVDAESVTYTVYKIYWMGKNNIGVRVVDYPPVKVRRSDFE